MVTGDIILGETHHLPRFRIGQLQAFAKIAYGCCKGPFCGSDRENFEYLLVKCLCWSNNIVIRAFKRKFIRLPEQIAHILRLFCPISAVDCGPLRTPVNGSLVGNLTVFPNSVLFVCEPGFILGGSVFRACQANGTWGGLETTCSGKGGDI